MYKNKELCGTLVFSRTRLSDTFLFNLHYAVKATSSMSLGVSYCASWLLPIIEGAVNKKQTFALMPSEGRVRRAAEAAELCTTPDIQPVMKILILL